MTPPSFERLLKVLELEEKQAWRNRSVVGGMQAMSERWAADAHEEEADAQIVSVVVALMARYEEMDKAARTECVATMRRALAGDLSGLDDLAEAATDRDETDAADDAPSALENASKTGTSGERASKQNGARRQQSPNPNGPAIQSADVPPPEPTDVARERTRKQQPQRSGERRRPRDLQATVDILPGVGKVAAEQLARLGIHQVVDLLWHLPTRHEDYSQLRTIADLEPGEQVTVIANLWEVRERKISRNRTMIQGILADGTGTLHATWWNKYVVKQLIPGSTLRFSGKVGLYMGQKTLGNPAFEELDTDMVDTGRLAPVYPLTEGLSNKRLRNLVKLVLDEFGRFLSDPLPQPVRQKYKLPYLAKALSQYHFPDSPEQLEAARRRLAFADFFYIQLGVLRRRQDLNAQTAPALPSDDALLTRFTASLPFGLTGAQRRVIHEIQVDLARTVPMTRLVQGDVGSGKTAVAAAAMFITAVHGAQSALIAPTQILAEQHHRGLRALLSNVENADGQPLNVALLTGRITGQERQRVLDGLRTGHIDVVVGTTALIQDGVDFHNLGLAIVDEQHRFGVEQRGALRRDEQHAHLLVMSATPIPRSLALTVYGDLDLSVIDEMPPGRTPVKTKWFLPKERERLYSFLRSEVKKGRQGFIVYPLVEESEKLNAGAAVKAYEQLRDEIFPAQRLALLHGRMSGAEKDEIMRAFAAGEYDILVSTSVIEVGIDVPNASLIIIENAERFGLAQLHQFRGRVGRGEHASYCALVSDADNDEAEERLTALQDSNDGFELAEKDLDMRGPGEFFGTRQSGLPELRAAQLGDLDTLLLARAAAQDIFATDPELRKYKNLARQVERFWRGHGDVS